jgi:hypothetical protein
MSQRPNIRLKKGAAEHYRLKRIAAKYPQRDEPIADEEICEALMDADGSIMKAAKLLKMRSDHLRRMVVASTTLSAFMDEIMECGVDQAVAIILAGLRDQENFLNRFYAAKEMLRSEAGRKRGFGPREMIAVDAKTPERKGAIVLKWLEPEEPRAIEPPKEEENEEGKE